jgi:hypothetical protein
VELIGASKKCIKNFMIKCLIDYMQNYNPFAVTQYHKCGIDNIDLSLLKMHCKFFCKQLSKRLVETYNINESHAPHHHTPRWHTSIWYGRSRNMKLTKGGKGNSFSVVLAFMRNGIVFSAYYFK